MATTTPRIGLTKPDGTDLVDIAVLNTNFDKIDSNIASTKIQATKPATANAGDLWWDSDTGTLYLYYVDANSSQWVAATSDPINIGVVASQAERDAQYPTPAQGMSVYRTDLGVTQRYYGLYNSSTNVGGRATAGWYDVDKSVGFTPIRPTSVTLAGTGSQSAATNALGMVEFLNCSTVIVNGVFSSKYTNYKILISNVLGTVSAGANLYFRLAAGGTQESNGIYYWVGAYQQNNNASGNLGGAPGTEATIGYSGSYSWGLSTVDVCNPFVSGYHTSFYANGMGTVGSGTIIRSESSGDCVSNTQFDGFAIFVGGGLTRGKIQVLGWNE